MDSNGKYKTENLVSNEERTKCVQNTGNGSVRGLRDGHGLTERLPRNCEQCNCYPRMLLPFDELDRRGRLSRSIAAIDWVNMWSLFARRDVRFKSERMVVATGGQVRTAEVTLIHPDWTIASRVTSCVYQCFRGRLRQESLNGTVEESCQSDPCLSTTYSKTHFQLVFYTSVLLY